MWGISFTLFSSWTSLGWPWSVALWDITRCPFNSRESGWATCKCMYDCTHNCGLLLKLQNITFNATHTGFIRQTQHTCIVSITQTSILLCCMSSKQQESFFCFLNLLVKQPRYLTLSTPVTGKPVKLSSSVWRRWPLYRSAIFSVPHRSPVYRWQHMALFIMILRKLLLAHAWPMGATCFRKGCWEMLTSGLWFFFHFRAVIDEINTNKVPWIQCLISLGMKP